MENWKEENKPLIIGKRDISKSKQTRTRQDERDISHIEWQSENNWGLGFVKSKDRHKAEQPKTSIS